MTRETFERAKELDAGITRVSKIIEYIEERCGQTMFLTDEPDNFIVLDINDVQCILDAFESRKNVLEHELSRL